MDRFDRHAPRAYLESQFVRVVQIVRGRVLRTARAYQRSGLSLDRICAEFHFSARERDIIQMILKGKSNKEIEQELFISSHTVKNHIYHIFQKAGVKSRGQLVSVILQNSAEVVH